MRWGHPEDAVAIGLLLYAVLALTVAKPNRAAWLAGAAVAVQPLALLAFPLLAIAAVEPRRLPGFVARAATPAVVLLAAAAAANWTATIHAVTNQPNAPSIDHPTPWIYLTFLAPHMSGGSVAAGPARALAVLVACGCGVITWRRWQTARLAGAWRPDDLAALLWWIAVTLALRTMFEPVMVSYYVWPPLAVALVAASRDWLRLIPAAATATVLTFLAQSSWRNPWVWWTPSPRCWCSPSLSPGPAGHRRRRCCQSRGSSSSPTARHEAISSADSVVTEYGVLKPVPMVSLIPRAARSPAGPRSRRRWRVFFLHHRRPHSPHTQLLGLRRHHHRAPYQLRPALRNAWAMTP